MWLQSQIYIYIYSIYTENIINVESIFDKWLENEEQAILKCQELFTLSLSYALKKANWRIS